MAQEVERPEVEKSATQASFKSADVVVEELPDDVRGTWASPMEFVLSCLGYAVGLGNVWRFPYLCYQNGGGAFLIPYAIMLCFVGLPVFFIELSVGQYASSGPMTLWSVSPIFKGVGAGMMIISFIGNIYYNMIIAWSMYYTWESFAAVLPWSNCKNDFNTKYCYSSIEAKPCEVTNGTYANGTCYNMTTASTAVTTFVQNIVKHRTGASEEFFTRKMLVQSSRIEDTGAMQPHLVVVLILAWVICFLCVIRGIKSSGKVVYVTATFPYLVLVILFVRGVTLEGAWDGIKFYLVPEWDQLLKPKVWGDAAGQIFFSLSVGMGGLMTFASYNKFNNNVYRDTLIVTIGNCLTSFFAGFVIFSILGFMAHERGVTVPEVAKSGSALAFIAYPEVVTHMWCPQLWSVLFFLMLLTLGLDSQFAGVENLMTGIVDTWPHMRKYKSWVALSLCVVLGILGLTMCTEAGIYWLELMSYYAAGWSLVLIGLVECCVFSWVYGATKLIDNIEEMVGFRLKNHWWVCWTIITPILLTVVLIVNIIEFTPLAVGDYVMPTWAQTLGWLMATAPIASVVLYAVHAIFVSYDKQEFDGLSFFARIKQLSSPTEKWYEYGKKNKKHIELNQVDVMTDSGKPPSYY